MSRKLLLRDDCHVLTNVTAQSAGDAVSAYCVWLRGAPKHRDAAAKPSPSALDSARGGCVLCRQDNDGSELRTTVRRKFLVTLSCGGAKEPS